MSFGRPLLLIAAVLLSAAAVGAYAMVQRRRTAVLAAAGLGRPSGGRVRRHLPYALFLAALPILLAGLAGPKAEFTVPHAAGTVLLAFDVSNSMTATDVAPNRLAAAKSAAKRFVADQPDAVDVGVIVFGNQAMLTQKPTDDRAATLAAIDRAAAGGGTSLGQAVLVALGAITGKPVGLPRAGAPAPDPGYWPSATVVVFSDGQETGGPDVTAAAELAARAGVRVQTIGVGTARGATVEVDGFQLATALDEKVLTGLAQATGGSYHAAGDPRALAGTTDAIDLRLTMRTEPYALTGPFAGAALLLLTIGGLLGVRWHGRIL